MNDDEEERKRKVLNHFISQKGDHRKIIVWFKVAQMQELHFDK